jgi:hypothetical protein
MIKITKIGNHVDILPFDDRESSVEITRWVSPTGLSPVFKPRRDIGAGKSDPDALTRLVPE